MTGYICQCNNYKLLKIDINLYWNESNKTSLNYIITYKLKIKYKLRVIEELCQKSNGTNTLNRREYKTVYIPPFKACLNGKWCESPLISNIFTFHSKDISWATLSLEFRYTSHKIKYMRLWHLNMIKRVRWLYNFLFYWFYILFMWNILTL